MTQLGDFTTNRWQLAKLSGLAVVVGVMGGLVAFLLLRLIGLITHLAYDGTWQTSLVAPSITRLGWWSVLIPVIGGVAVGFLARYGSEQIRGHGIPEAIQAILENESRMQPRVALVKPIASAITIGTGGPFGAEGPIIMTGGALGSLLAQWLPLSSTERRVLLVAGAAAGMSATFGAPISSVFLAVELLLFEWRPRSVLPVMVASTMAYGVRVVLLGSHPIFQTTTLSWHGLAWLPWAGVIGVAGGLASGLLTKFVYLIEDAYGRLPIHWMWWPAIGGLLVGLGGMVDPAALGVGYPIIRALDAGHVLVLGAATLLIVKATIWVLSLSSGTSGGVLAPLLMMGAAVGVLLSPLLPGHAAGLWATVGMAAMLGGTMRAPFTATVFAMETTHDWTIVLPVFIGSMVAMAVTVLWIPRSILTEKVARRGTHVAREYGVHPLEGIAVRALMVPRRQVMTVPLGDTLGHAAEVLLARSVEQHGAYPVVDESGQVVGVLTRRALLKGADGEDVPLPRVMATPVRIRETARAREAIELMVRHDTRALLVEGPDGWTGWMTQANLFAAWQRALGEENQRSRVFTLHARALRPSPRPAKAMIPTSPDGSVAVRRTVDPAEAEEGED